LKPLIFCSGDELCNGGGTTAAEDCAVAATAVKDCVVATPFQKREQSPWKHDDAEPPRMRRTRNTIAAATATFRSGTCSNFQCRALFMHHFLHLFREPMAATF